ncbi:MAG: ABC transporter ATP-binding protein [Planctomycetota bacterium]|jgi:iron(III) transport system ATP-binding protein
MTAVRLERLSRRFGPVRAVDGVDLEIRPGALFFLLGPSGCGKTTLLRLIAGLVEPTAGRVWFDDRDMTGTAPARRGAGMVFQSYALWPHLTVRENVAYGLKVRGAARGDRRRAVDDALRAVDLGDCAERRPATLSGGQQQRVALARALVVRPRVLLLDEPLSNLDAPLREEMREEVRRICRRAGITSVYVTHDRVEALAVADEIALLRDGRVEQVGAPRELYDRPVNRFAASFLGDTNLLPAVVAGAEGGAVRLETPAGPLLSTAGMTRTPKGGNVTCSIRPEAIRTAAPGATGNVLRGVRRDRVYLGPAARSTLELSGGQAVRILEPGPSRDAATATEMVVAVDPDDVVILAD